MKIIFISNFFNYHQEMLSVELLKQTEGEYYFIQTGVMDSNRKTMGWSEKTPEYVIKYDEEKDRCENLIDSAEVVIIGSADHSLIRKRLAHNKLTFLYFERLHKKKYNYLKLIKHLPLFFYHYGRHKTLYCLCASAFTSFDFSKTLTLLGKCYKWGYFPKSERYNEQMLTAYRNHDVCELLYVGRLIDWKHPELPVMVVKRLKEEGIDCHLSIVGTGEMKDSLLQQIEKAKLADNVTLVGSILPEQVRDYMLQSDVFMFTSDRGEGWGAVLNEAMNSGCAVVASSEIGSVPFMMNDGFNGHIYEDGNFEDLYKKVKDLCKHKEKRHKMGLEAYKTVAEIWNAENAVNRLMLLIEDIQKQGYSNRFADGPCSRAEIIRDGWYR